MRKSIFALLLPLGAVLLFATSSEAQPLREDVIWARTTSTPIVLDGVLDEAAWSQAETKNILFGTDSGLPGSGWKIEGGLAVPNDSTKATLKFLVHGNQLYMGADVQDENVGGSQHFNRFDGFLMSLKDHGLGVFPAPVAEYFYAWWYESLPDPQPVGQEPAFIGSWGSWPAGTPRDSTQIANWDAVTVVHGVANSDSTAGDLDTGYTVEMRFNLTPMGYDVTQPGGDVLEWNISVYDCDGWWPFVPANWATNTVWWQSPWGNTAWYHQVQIHASPEVTTSSGSVPSIGPALVFTEVDGGTAPNIDGQLTDAIWNDPSVYTFDIRWNDDALRESYPAQGPYRSGQFETDLDGDGDEFIADPADATVRVFHKDDFLYLGFDARDEVVQHHPVVDRMDGFLVSLNMYDERDPARQQILGQRLLFHIVEDGGGVDPALDDLLALTTAGDAELAIHLNPGTTVDTTGFDVDAGYQAELKIDLNALGWPEGLGDGRIFLGVNHLDGDSYFPTDESYGTRTWWFREWQGTCCGVVGYLASAGAIGVDDFVGGPPPGYSLLGSFPNPAANATIRFALPEANAVVLDVFDVRGRLVERQDLGIVGAGVQGAELAGTNRPSGVYLYRLQMTDPEDGSLRAVLHGKATLLK